MLIHFERTCEYEMPLRLVADSAADWTHFMHVHRRSHLEFRLLAKDGVREIFLYKARMIYPLPFYRTFIAFREYLPEQEGYHQIYLHVNSGAIHYLNSRTEGDDHSSRTIGTFYFEGSRFWKYFPGLFKKLFTWRMRSVSHEDRDWMSERIRIGVFENKGCMPQIPDCFNLMDDFLKKGLPAGELSLKDRIWDGIKPQ